MFVNTLMLFKGLVGFGMIHIWIIRRSHELEWYEGFVRFTTPMAVISTSALAPRLSFRVKRQ